MPPALLRERLPTDGLLERTPDPDDPRSVRGTPTPAGETALSTGSERFDGALDSLLDGTDAAAIADGLAAVERMHHLLSRAAS